MQENNTLISRHVQDHGRDRTTLSTEVERRVAAISQAYLSFRLAYSDRLALTRGGDRREACRAMECGNQFLYEAHRLEQELVEYVARWEVQSTTWMRNFYEAAHKITADFTVVETSGLLTIYVGRQHVEAFEEVARQHCPPSMRAIVVRQTAGELK